MTWLSQLIEISAALCLNLHPSSSCWWTSSVALFITVSGNRCATQYWICYIISHSQPSRKQEVFFFFYSGEKKILLGTSEITLEHDQLCQRQRHFSPKEKLSWHLHRLTWVAVGTPHLLGWFSWFRLPHWGVDQLYFNKSFNRKLMCYCILISSWLFHIIEYLYLNVCLCIYDNSLNMWESWIKQFEQINQGLRISWGAFCTISFSISFGTEMSLISVCH